MCVSMIVLFMWYYSESMITVWLLTSTPMCMQLIYDFKDGGGTFGLMSLHPDKISEEDRKRFKKIGVLMPSML